jgi:midasin
MVQLLRFSSYLSGFILGEQVDYSALQVVVRWISEALQAVPSGFESIVAQAEKLDNLIRLTSGWGLYDIWNAFLTDVTPSNDCQPLEMLERVSSFWRTAGKGTILGIRVGLY